MCLSFQAFTLFERIQWILSFHFFRKRSWILMWICYGVNICETKYVRTFVVYVPFYDWSLMMMIFAHYGKQGVLMSFFLQGRFMYASNLHYVGHLVNADNYDTNLARPDFYQMVDNKLVREIFHEPCFFGIYWCDKKSILDKRNSWHKFSMQVTQHCDVHPFEVVSLKHSNWMFWMFYFFQSLPVGYFGNDPISWDDLPVSI